ncbi:MAG TPA: hypothetical protein VN703_01040 [Candidatus Sulfopaludibacter sp.]|nr:hypothetical protein [Candidatus Sulfopaludibacter sp.]
MDNIDESTIIVDIGETRGGDSDFRHRIPDLLNIFIKWFVDDVGSFVYLLVHSVVYIVYSMIIRSLLSYERLLKNQIFTNSSRLITRIRWYLL